jgi:hypothetical protein
VSIRLAVKLANVTGIVEPEFARLGVLYRLSSLLETFPGIKLEKAFCIYSSAGTIGTL